MNDDMPTNDEPSRVSRLETPPDADLGAGRGFAPSYEPLPHEPLPGERKARRFDSIRNISDTWSTSVATRYRGAPPTDDERLWAAVAHASAWITLFGGIVSIGAILPVSVFIPLVIFFVFRKRSEFIAFHAIQAFVLQLIATVGVVVLFAAGAVVWVIGAVIAAVAMLVLVGFVLLPLWALVGVLGSLALLLLPLAMVLLATIAALETFRGRDYRYPIISRWIDGAMTGDDPRSVRYI